MDKVFTVRGQSLIQLVKSIKRLVSLEIINNSINHLTYSYIANAFTMNLFPFQVFLHYQLQKLLLPVSDTKNALTTVRWTEVINRCIIDSASSLDSLSVFNCMLILKFTKKIHQRINERLNISLMMNERLDKLNKLNEYTLYYFSK